MPLLTLLAAVIGFTVGYRLKDILHGKNDPNNDIPKVNNAILPRTTDEPIHTAAPNTAFSLHCIDAVFRQFNVPLKSEYSFSRLLNTIEQDSYTSILKHIDSNISSPQELLHYLENEEFNTMQFEITASSSEPYLTDDSLNKILENNGVEYSQLNTAGDKVKFLLILAQGKGIKRFKELFGSDLNFFIDKSKSSTDNDNDINFIYDSIKSTIHKRLEFLS